jgi:23S rRNA pseudouridine1911/1915/1917 synthase
MEMTQYNLTIPVDLAGKRLDQALAVLLPDYSRSRLKEWILAGEVTVDGASVMPRSKVRVGQCINVNAIIEVQERSRPEPIGLESVFEDDAVLVINKPVGLVVHPGAGNPSGTLLNGLLHHAPDLANLPRCGILHRLDKNTSGLLLVAKTLPAHTHLVRDLQQRAITREYRAVCTGRVTAGGHVEAPIGRHATQRTRMAVTDKGKPAVTHYRVLARFANHTFLALRLETGRTHQIRVHMAHLRHALVGDPTYAGRLKIPAGTSPPLATALRGLTRQALHASRLTFRHPLADKTIECHAPLPGDFSNLLSVLADDVAAETRDAADWDRMTWPQPISN